MRSIRSFSALPRQFGSFQKRKMLANRVAVRALELILCRLRAMLQGYLFKHPPCLQEPSTTQFLSRFCSYHTPLFLSLTIIDISLAYDSTGAALRKNEIL